MFSETFFGIFLITLSVTVISISVGLFIGMTFIHWIRNVR
jgi:hypothetical protein